MRPPPPPPAATPRTTGGFGLGCAGLLLVFLAVVSGGLLLWMNPDWLDRHAFWRPPIIEPEVLLVVDAAQKKLLAERDAASAKAQDPYKRVVYFEGGSVEADYSPAAGAQMQTREGAIVHFPPGALHSAARIRLTPIMRIPADLIEPGMVGVGPAYRIMINGEPRHDFATPVDVTMPYDPDAVDPEAPGNLAIFVGRNGHWTRVPTDVDDSNHLLHARVPQSSWWVAFQWGVRGLVVAGSSTAIGYCLSSTVRGAWHTWTGTVDQVYKTTNFAIHYTNTGNDAVYQDGARLTFPFKPPLPQKDVPGFVVLVGSHLEYILPRLDQVGMAIPSGYLRHDVFLTNMGNSYGESPPGGPVWITTQWTEGIKFPKNLDANFRGTIAHELIHASQGQFFSNRQGRNNKWWFEMSAPWLAERFWKAVGQPTDQVFLTHMYDDNGKTLTYSMSIDKSEVNYSYASFLKWLEDKIDVAALVSAMNKGGDASVQAFAALVQSQTGRSLGDLLHEYAKKYYHLHLWDGKTMPLSLFEYSAAKQVEMQSSGPASFKFAARSAGDDPNGPFGETNLWDETEIGQMPALVSRAYIVDLNAIPSKRKGKLVLQYKGADNADLSLDFAASQVGTKLPATGRQGVFQPLTADPPQRIIEPVGRGTGTDRITIIASNLSATEPVRGGVLSRWLLLAPSFASSMRDGESNHWRAGWQRAELKEVSKVWGGYNVYRRKPGEGDAAWVRVKEKCEDEIYEEDAPDAEDYVYTASVVDQDGNESEKAEIDDGDPFQGLWRGKLILIEGDVIQPMIDWLQGEMGDSKDPSVQKALAFLKDLLRKLDKLLRLGLPIELRVTREKGLYYVKAERVFRFKVDSEKKPLERLGATGLTFVDKEGKPPILLQLHRKGELRSEIEVPPEPGQKTGQKWRIELARVDTGGVP